MRRGAWQTSRFAVPKSLRRLLASLATALISTCAFSPLHTPKMCFSPCFLSFRASTSLRRPTVSRAALRGSHGHHLTTHAAPASDIYQPKEGVAICSSSSCMSRYRRSLGQCCMACISRSTAIALHLSSQETTSARRDWQALPLNNGEYDD
jgi:hypothetical protein